MIDRTLQHFALNGAQKRFAAGSCQRKASVTRQDIDDCILILTRSRAMQNAGEKRKENPNLRRQKVQTASSSVGRLSAGAPGVALSRVTHRWSLSRHLSRRALLH